MRCVLFGKILGSDKNPLKSSFGYKRPSAQELLKSRFVRSAPKGTDRLLKLIFRHEQWKRRKKHEGEPQDE